MSISSRKRNKLVNEALRADLELQKFILTDVTVSSEVLGTGSYGSVKKVCIHKI